MNKNSDFISYWTQQEMRISRKLDEKFRKKTTFNQWFVKINIYNAFNVYIVTYSIKHFDSKCHNIYSRSSITLYNNISAMRSDISLSQINMFGQHLIKKKKICIHMHNDKLQSVLPLQQFSHTFLLFSNSCTL